MTSLDEFCDGMIERICKFKKWWVEQNKIDPKVFPMKFLPGDWDEQLLFFDEEAETK